MKILLFLLLLGSDQALPFTGLVLGKKASTVACAGASVGGFCWYLGALGESCDTVCTTHGGCSTSGTVDFAGYGTTGTLANCQSVQSAFTYSGAFDNAGPTQSGCGCTLTGSDAPRRNTAATTTCSASNATGAKRFCACVN